MLFLVVASPSESVHEMVSAVCKEWGLEIVITSARRITDIHVPSSLSAVPFLLLDSQLESDWHALETPDPQIAYRVILLNPTITKAAYLSAIDHGMIDVIDDVHQLPRVLMRERAEDHPIMTSLDVRSALESTSKALVLLDNQGIVRVINHRAQTHFRSFYGIELAVGACLIDLLPPKGRAMYEQRMEIVKSGNSVSIDIIPLGYDREFNFEYQPVHGIDGAVIGVNITFEDITERKALERRLRFHASVYENITDAVIVTDINYNIQGWNRGAEMLYGWTAAEVMGKPVQPIIQTEFTSIESLQESHDTLHKTGISVSPSIVQHRRDGTAIFVHSAVILLKDEKGTLYSVVACNHDVTEQHNAERALTEALMQERELSNLKTRFVSMASHEFRTPLAMILAAAETVLIYRHRMIETQINERLERIRAQVLYMTSILEDVLQLTRLESGQTPVALMYGDLAAFCGALVTEYISASAENRRITITGTHPPIFAYFDQRLIRQAVINVLSNAIKYSTAETEVRVIVEVSGDQVYISVRDQGIGIPPEDLSRLFVPFHRAANVGTISGTGLGLSIAKQSIDLHQGTITAVSEPGMGTTVTMMIPLVLTAPSGSSSEPPPG